uniref:Protocadherin Fat 2-like n=1 Tax=Saccoglossus kowalevskii TaxID=10224 RepID=A0ABM0GTX6_SACKO|nr:PREDICTED: protocadherin Fat 2-like [Saccoglossus kowalevskii]
MTCINVWKCYIHWAFFVCIGLQQQVVLANLPPSFVEIPGSSPTKYYDMDLERFREDIPLGEIIYTLIAYDPEGSCVYFEILEGEEYFGLPNTNCTHAEVMLVEQLDYEDVTEIEVTWRLRDYDVNGGSGNDVETDIKVYLIDVNDNAPIFVGVPYNTELYENTTVGDVIYRVYASDADSGSNSQMVFSLEYEDEYLFSIGNIVNSNGHAYCDIVLNSSMDYELDIGHEITVTAKDQGSDPETLSSTARIMISVIDVQDTPPYWLNEPYRSLVYDFTSVAIEIDPTQVITERSTTTVVELKIIPGIIVTVTPEPDTMSGTYIGGMTALIVVAVVGLCILLFCVYNIKQDAMDPKPVYSTKNQITPAPNEPSPEEIKNNYYKTSGVSEAKIKGSATDKLAQLHDIRDKRLCELRDSRNRMDDICSNIPRSLVGVNLDQIGYHRGGYQNFTKNKDRLKSSNMPSNEASTSRSPRKPSSVMYMFPPECIFCGKQEVKVSGKTERCSKFSVFKDNSGTLYEPTWKQIESRALEVGNISLHRMVQGEYLFEREANSHQSCRKSFNLQYVNHMRDKSQSSRYVYNTEQGRIADAHLKSFNTVLDFINNYVIGKTWVC